MTRALWLCGLSAIAAGCYPDHYFNCLANDALCSPNERCLVDHCAANDPACPGGYRYTSSAGDLAGLCLASAPDGGVTCINTGDPCDDGDPCTTDDKCTGKVCQGKPKVCPAASCSLGIETVQSCVMGACTGKDTSCSPYHCAGATCSVLCVTGDDCASGYYCASGKCLSCGDYLTDVNFLPVFGAPAAIPGVNVPLAADLAPFLSRDGRTLSFASSRAGGKGGLDLYQATRPVADQTTPFANVTNLSLNGAADDTDLFTLDGKSYIFASDRGAKGDFDLLATAFDMAMFSPPVALAGGDMSGPIDTAPARELHATLTSDGLRLFFASDRSSPGPGDPLLRIFGASRKNGADPFGPVTALAGLDPLADWTSPSVADQGGALFLVNAAVPSRSEAVIVHLDGGGAPLGTASVLHAIDLGGGGEATLSADGCALLYSNTTADAAGDLAWSFRKGLISCAAATCGASDGCCPANCADLLDADCPYPRTVELSELVNATGKHDYILDGESAPPGYAATGGKLRVFRDPSPNLAALNRFTSTTCDGKGTYYRLGIEAMPPSGFQLDRVVGYLAPAIAGTRGLVRVWRAIREVGPFCDEQVTFDNAGCTNLQNMNMGYSCDSSLGFAVQP